MSTHPSLAAEFIDPGNLHPTVKMPVNARCWCGSGVKWKKCHKDREHQEPIPIGKLLDDQHAEFADGYCLHPEASAKTCGKIIKAHTVQRRGGLAAIAEDGHVISTKRGFEEIFKNEGEIVPSAIGVKRASTFMGFCDLHDNGMFEPIEKAPIVLDKQAVFLLSFRAICYELLMKDIADRSIEIKRQLDKGRDFAFQRFLQSYLHYYRAGTERAMQDIAAWKQTYDTAYKGGNYNDFSFFAVLFSDALPIVSCGAFYPEFDFAGKPLQIITRGEGGFEHVCFNLTVVSGKSIAVFGRTGEPGGPADQFCNSFRSLPKASMANAAFHLACEYIENTYFRPSWWNGQSDEIRKYLIHRFRSGIGPAGPERKADCLSKFPYTLASSNVAQELS